MRSNPYGVPYLKGARFEKGIVYYWLPPKKLIQAKIYHQKTLGSDFASAVAQAKELNRKLEVYRQKVSGPRKPKLRTIKPMTAAYLVRLFEASPKFAQYVPRSQKDYSDQYRNSEIEKYDGKTMFGHMRLDKITRQFAYSIYEQCVVNHGPDSASKTIDAWRAAFKYGGLKIPEIASNPFTQLGIHRTPSRRQRWTDQQLTSFIKKADEMGHPEVGRLALMCMELMQRPGDMLSLTWGAYREDKGVWYIYQSKRGVEVWVPPTKRLKTALNAARLLAQKESGGDISDKFICPTVTGKRYDRHDFNKKVRLIRRAVGIPEDIQIRDLRRTAATEGASAGATPSEMMAAGGWQNFSSIRPYLIHTPEQAAAFQAKREAYRARHRVRSAN